jgi:hypothetical protein
MKVIFQNNHLDIRGTGDQNYQYALYNEEILGNDSIIICKNNSPFTDYQVVEKFEKRFKVIWYDNNSEIDSICSNEKVDLFYALKSGGVDDAISTVCKSCVHGVFDLFPHGDRYAVISDWLSNNIFVNRGFISSVVPHIIDVV